MQQLLADGEVDFAFAFNPAEASSAIAAGELPDTVRTFIFAGGTLGNTHFVAIPFNAAAKAGAMVVADFLMSPEAQARKQDPRSGATRRCSPSPSSTPDDRARFDALTSASRRCRRTSSARRCAEPHPSWMERDRDGVEAALWRGN